MILKSGSNQKINVVDTTVKIRCPACRQRGTFDAVQDTDITILDQDGRNVAMGQRKCPDPHCCAHIFFASNREDGKLLVVYPPETLDFDSTDLPAAVLTTFEEAVKCHAHNCSTASAIMVRKTLEELCKDRGAKGNDLKARLADLRKKIILPQELMDGLDDLRLLGNDAAHIESKEYDNVGPEEVEIALEVTKEILKAVYQYSSLLGKLRKLKKTAP